MQIAAIRREFPRMHVVPAAAFAMAGLSNTDDCVYDYDQWWRRILHAWLKCLHQLPFTSVPGSSGRRSPPAALLAVDQSINRGR